MNSTVACSLVSAKREIAVGHVEAGLRSFDRSMPEEINRVVTDSLSDLLFASEEAGVENLRREGVPDGNVFFVGNVMIDTLLAHRERAGASNVFERLGLEDRGYAVLTLHRPSNVDDRDTLTGIVGAIEQIAAELPVVFPVHPRTRSRLEELGLSGRLDPPGASDAGARLRMIEPQGYLDFLKLTSSARLILTDSGGIQEEATILQVPCLTLRENTERPTTLASGWNRLVGSQPERILAAFRDVANGGGAGTGAPALWDGSSGDRIARTLMELGTEGLHRLRLNRSAAPGSAISR